MWGITCFLGPYGITTGGFKSPASLCRKESLRGVPKYVFPKRIEIPWSKSVKVKYLVKFQTESVQLN